ncbi:MAG TPA: type II secretion system protein [Firmicutes bacterium]|jgi:hypothetical protein|nr:type II secretion system protein [Bacillota bacterium]
MERIKREDGFTLVETIAVLTVLVLIYSLTLQGIGRSHQRLVEKADLRQITGDLQLLQMESRMKPGYILQAVFYPTASGEGCRYRLDFGYQVVDREVRGLRLAGEEERRIVLYRPESVGEDEEDTGGVRRFAVDEEDDSSFEAEEICLVGSTQREYSLVIQSGGELEVTTR